MLTKEQIKELAELMARATRAPWFTVQQPWRPRDVGTWIIAGSPDPHAGKPILDSMDIDEWPADQSGPDYSQSDADLEFVARARNLLPAILTHIAQQDKHLALLRDEVRAWRASFCEHSGKQIGDASDCRDIEAARFVTDAAGALGETK